MAIGLSAALAVQSWLIRRAWHRVAARPPDAVIAPTAVPGAGRPPRLLVVGDSTGVGLGSGTPAQSLHGRLQLDLVGAEIVNRSRVGARVQDVARQLAPLRQANERFDFALVLVGGNDILQMTPLVRLGAEARTVLGLLRPLARTVVWVGCADVGLAPCLIAPFTWLLSLRSRQVARRLQAAADEAGVAFIDFVDHPLSAEFSRRRDRYFAADGVHPSGYAYGRCHEVLKAHPGFSALASGRRETATGASV